MRKLLFISTLVGFSLVASAKQYSFTLVQPVQVGAVKLAPGEYKVSVEGSTATFTDHRRKTFSAPVRVEKTSKKNEVTAVETKEANGAEEIKIIDIGGADFKLVF